MWKCHGGSNSLWWLFIFRSWVSGRCLCFAVEIFPSWWRHIPIQYPSPLFSKTMLHCFMWHSRHSNLLLRVQSSYVNNLRCENVMGSVNSLWWLFIFHSWVSGCCLLSFFPSWWRHIPIQWSSPLFSKTMPHCFRCFKNGGKFQFWPFEHRVTTPTYILLLYFLF